MHAICEDFVKLKLQYKISSLNCEKEYMLFNRDKIWKQKNSLYITNFVKLRSVISRFNRIQISGLMLLQLHIYQLDNLNSYSLVKLVGRLLLGVQGNRGCLIFTFKAEEFI